MYMHVYIYIYIERERERERESKRSQTAEKAWSSSLWVDRRLNTLYRKHVRKKSTGPKILREFIVTPSAMENGRNVVWNGFIWIE
jgi:hypothetical protein